MADRISLRPYQEAAVNNAISMLEERGNSLIVAGTGAGKTIMMAAAIGRFFGGFYAKHRRRPHALVLVHRTEIHGQNHEKFTRVCPEIQTSEITAERKSLHGYIHFGMLQTVVNLLPDFAAAGSFFDLIVIDEAHHAKASTYEKIIEWNRSGKPDMYLLGVTATPNRGDKLPLIELFDNYYQITTKYLMDSHYLVRPTMIDAAPVFKTEGGEEKGHLARNCRLDDIEGRNLISELCHKYVQLMQPGQTIVFAPSHEFCEVVYDELKFMGRRPAYLSLGIDDDTRKGIINAFSNGNYTELINVDICTEGFDYPELRNLVEFDTNGTQGQWIQKVGRVLRTAPGKTSCTVIDFGGNIDMYPDGVETDVNLEGAMKKPKGERLTGDDFFKIKSNKKERLTAEYVNGTSEQFTPYHPPVGFETVMDNDFGAVFAACGAVNDCILVPGSENTYTAYLTDKVNIIDTYTGDFNTVALKATEKIGNPDVNPDRPISKMQIKLLAPEYSTAAMDWYQANCCITWKVWKEVIRQCLNKNAELKISLNQ